MLTKSLKSDKNKLRGLQKQEKKKKQCFYCCSKQTIKKHFTVNLFAMHKLVFLVTPPPFLFQLLYNFKVDYLFWHQDQLSTFLEHMKTDIHLDKYYLRSLCGEALSASCYSYLWKKNPQIRIKALYSIFLKLPPFIH